VTLAGPSSRSLRLVLALYASQPYTPHQVAAQLGHAEIVALFEQEEEQRDAAYRCPEPPGAR
jgi:hypothetical protein